MPRPSRLVAPWGIYVPGSASEFPKSAHVSQHPPPLFPGGGFYIVTSGQCLLRLDDEREYLTLHSGDLMLLPHGGAHVLCDAPTSPVSPIWDLLTAQQMRAHEGVQSAHHIGDVTTFICGGLIFDAASQTNPLSILPRVMHLKRTPDNSLQWLDEIATMALRELAAPTSGTRAILDRLTQILVMHAIRLHHQQHAADHPQPTALFDQQLGPLLQGLRSSLAVPWTVEALAQEAMMSRSAFAARFSRVVGDSPLQYLKKLRMKQAAHLLRSSEAGIKQIAAAVGYESEAAFCGVFKKTFQLSPGAYRKRLRARHSSPPLPI